MADGLPWWVRARIFLGAVKADAFFGGVDLAAWLVCGRRIGGGLFQGMAYTQLGWRSAFAPKLIGSYEAELIPVIDWVRRAGFDRLVNVGCAEGYYAVGLAWTARTVRVDAFEIDPRIRARLDRHAAGNGVSDRIEMHGKADTTTLRAVLAGMPEPFLLVDIEGGERDLLDPAAVPELQEAWLLVESHPSLQPDVEPVLRTRFAASHRVFRLADRDWRSQRADGARYVRFHWLARLACFRAERRGIQTPWLFMAPRSAARRFDASVVPAAREL